MQKQIHRNRTRCQPSKPVLLILIALAVGVAGHVPRAIAVNLQEDDRPLQDQPYLGLSVRDSPDGTKAIVGWIYPGPLEGTGFESKYVTRGDYVLAVNGRAISTADEFTNAITELKAGEEVSLRVQRTEGNTDASVPTPGEGTKVEEFTVVLASRAEWAGPVSNLRDNEDRVDPESLIRVQGGQTPLERFVFARVDENDLREPLDQLIAYFAETLKGSYGANMLDRVAYGFHYPTRLDHLQTLITDPLPAIVNDPAAIFDEAARNLDAVTPQWGPALDLSNPEDALDQASQALSASHLALDRAFAAFDEATLEMAQATMPEMADFVADNFYINSHGEVGRLIRTLNASTELEFSELLNAGAVLSGLMSASDAAPADTAATPLPDGLSDAVQGSIIAALEADGRWLVYGGAGSNTYDMSQIDVVIDAGGDDTYRYPESDRPRVQAVVDLAGNDTYTGESGGPASALLGVNLIVDQAGNDRYEGKSRSCGVGLMGVGVILDRAGADTYTGTQWSLGAAFYGLGAIIDLAGDSDVYTAETFSLAIGGPRGFGVILNENGRDLYRSNGPVGSVYGTDAVYAGISQGVGFGVRGYDTGGIGVLCDLNGHDRYEAGEFSQGGAYYWGLGILYDRAGRDLYYGNRYGQAFAAHQALGILADDAGDDTYWSMTAASQSGSWDICSTLLIDRGGDDTYQADGLAQGGASQQAIAWLVDLAGTDRYAGPGGATMGQSGGNNYHYDASRCFSFSLLLDAGGTADFYTRPDRHDAETISTGEFREGNPANSPLHGLFIDTAKLVTF